MIAREARGAANNAPRELRVDARLTSQGSWGTAVDDRSAELLTAGVSWRARAAFRGKSPHANLTLCCV